MNRHNQWSGVVTSHINLWGTLSVTFPTLYTMSESKLLGKQEDTFFWFLQHGHCVIIPGMMSCEDWCLQFLDLLSKLCRERTLFLSTFCIRARRKLAFKQTFYTTATSPSIQMQNSYKNYRGLWVMLSSLNVIHGAKVCKLLSLILNIRFPLSWSKYNKKWHMMIFCWNFTYWA